MIGGAELNAADFQIAVNVSAMMLSVDLAPFIEQRPAAALARRVAPDYAGRLGPVIPDEWLAPLRRQAAGGGGSPPATRRAPCTRRWGARPLAPDRRAPLTGGRAG